MGGSWSFFFLFLTTAWPETSLTEGLLAYRQRRQATSPTQVISNGLQELALDVSLAEYENGHIRNSMISPLSLGGLLSVLHLGAGSNSSYEIQLALGIPNSVNPVDVHSSFRNILGKYPSSGDGVTVDINNRIYVKEGTRVLASFTNNAEQFYDCSVRALDFQGQPAESMNEVNQWINRATKGKIPRLIEVPFSSDTSLVAINTLYLAAPWANTFPESSTRDATFDTGTEKVPVRMMHNVVTIPFIGSKFFEMIALPYVGNRMAMFILMPSKSSPSILAEMEYALDASKISTFINNMKSTTLNVGLPRMRLGARTHMKEVLQKLGVRSIFDPERADFSRMADGRLWAGSVVHEAVLEITEKGTVGAAASAVTLDRFGPSGSFILNRPAIIFIKDLENGLTLFWGKVLKPEPV